MSYALNSYPSCFHSLLQVQYAVQMQGTPGGSTAVTEVLDGVVKDANAIVPVLNQLITRMEAALGGGHSGDKKMASPLNLGLLLKLSQLMLSLMNLGAVDGAVLAFVEPRLSNTVDRALEAAVTSQASGAMPGGNNSGDASKLVQTLLALVQRLKPTGVAVETLDVSEMDFAAHSTSMRASTATAGGRNGHPGVRIVRNCAATGRVSQSRSRGHHGVGGDRGDREMRKRVSTTPMTGHHSRLSTVVDRGSTSSILTIDPLGSVLKQFAVSSIVSLVHTGEARQVAEALVHITSPRKSPILLRVRLK